MMNFPILESEIYCTGCGFIATEVMPVDACVYVYTCKRCGLELRPQPGECCVFCSYGSVPCPPVQLADSQS